MYLVRSLPDQAATVHDLSPLDPGLQGEPANDSGIYRRPRYHVADLNVLVAGLVGHVTGQVRPERVNVELSMAPGRPMVDGDPTELAFAIGGVISALLRSMEESDGTVLRVETRACADSIQVLITGDGVPPLRYVRALAASTDSGTADPTLAHCRRLLEAQGGTIDLAEEAGLLGFAIAFPTLPLSRPVRIIPASREAGEPASELRLAS